MKYGPKGLSKVGIVYTTQPVKRSSENVFRSARNRHWQLFWQGRWTMRLYQLSRTKELLSATAPCKSGPSDRLQHNRVRNSSPVRPNDSPRVRFLRSFEMKRISLKTGVPDNATVLQTMSHQTLVESCNNSG